MKALRFVAAMPLPNTALCPKFEIAVNPDKVCDSGPLIWTNDASRLIDLGDAGLLLGMLFTKNSGALLGCLPEDAPAKDGSEALAAWLVRECWGAYVAFLGDGASNELQVMVDPSGLCPVYRLMTRTHVVVASHPDLLSKASGLPLSVSWEALYCHLHRSELRRRSTCLSGITELAPGELARITGRSLEGRTIWRPDDFMPGNLAISFEEAAEELRSLAIKIVGAWAAALGPVTVAASGGVDSSFICAALKASGKDFSCATVATADPSGDERPFVDLLADHLGVESMSAIYDPEAIDPMRSVSVGLTRPTRKAFMSALDTALLQASQSVGADVIFDGNGGDNLFCFLHSSAPIIDRLFCEGLTPGLLSTFIDMCRLTGCDAPTMARASLRRLRRGRRFPAWHDDMTLLADAPHIPEHVDPLTPWFATEVGRHGGKRDHLALIMRTQQYVHGIGASGLPRFSPLMSQPLVEFCLRVPTWIWCKGGVNRALARAAFAAELPREILVRTSKSGPDSFILRNFDQHRHSIRNLLKDGRLAQNGVIDHAAVLDALKINGISGGPIIYRLLDLAEAEIWARSWEA